MEFFKNVWNKIKQPKGIYLALFYVFFMLLIAGTITLLIVNPNQTIGHYILYVLSAVCLTYFIYTIVIFAPKIKKGIISFLRKFNFTSNMLDNYGYRAFIFSAISLILNLAYMVLQGVLAILTRSAWYGCITIYYLILTLMKGNLFYSKKKHDTKERLAKAHRFCGIMFIMLTIAFSGVIVLIYKSNMYFEYAGIMIYVVAAYTFYSLILSIINIFKIKKHQDLHLESVTTINLATSLMSIIVLQVAMFQAFSPENNTSISNALTGAGVSLIIMVLGVLMIIKANKILKDKENINEKQ